jgi:FKBP-type peptidyl-prolyl cis-trans isomerase 2
LGEGMFLKGIDDFLIGKEVGNYQIELPPEKAFGVRLSQLVQMVPIKLFQSQKLNPQPGMTFNFDGRMAKVLTASGGRVIVDFNNPLAGKTVVYDIHILRKVEDLNEKIKSVIDFLFRRDFKFSVQDKKIVIEVEKQMFKFVEMFKEKFRDILDMELEIKEIEEKPKTPQ